MKYIVFFPVILLSVISCHDIETVSEHKVKTNVRIERSLDYVPKQETSYKVANYGKYSDFFKETDNLIGLSSSKSDNLSPHRIYGYVGPSANMSTKSMMDTKFNVEINDIGFSEAVLTKSSSAGLRALYGSIANFTISPQGITKSSSESTTVEMYIPKEINITNPYVKSDEKLLPLCYYEDFHLEWNKDLNNKNGIVVILDWIGEIVVGEDIPTTHVTRTCIFEDNGKAILPMEIFEGIPDTAVCHMTVLRGNIDVFSLEEISYKIQAESHEYMSFILIKEMRYV